MDQRSTEPSAGREATMIAALALPAMLLRTAQILEQDAGPALSDLRGFTADATTGALAALVVCALASVRRWLGITFGVAWVLAAHANYEHILALGSMTNLEHAGYLANSTFFFGTALAPTRPGLLGAALAMGVVLLLVAAPRREPSGPRSAARRRPSPRLTRISAVGLAGCALLLLWPLDETGPSWRQQHFAIANAAALFEAPLATDAPPVAHPIPGDLNGEPHITLPQPGRNVLLVILEGISGAHVARIREAQGEQSPVIMPELDAMAERGLVWSSFVSLQRQTNRGEYALLCGDGPKLVAGTPKMTELAGIGELACLPARLHQQGYTTVYLQGAPLPFMLKDQFMAQAGFSAVHGDEWFGWPSYGRNHWGNDDRAFFEGSAEMVRKLEAKRQPWMLTLMTVGTHHPFNVPDDFEGAHEPGSFEWAAEYLDDALGAFLRELEAEGLLDDTLVLVTSDESSGLHRSVDDVTKALGQAWGLLIALTPEGESKLVEETALQSDLALSVLDYLGFGDEAAKRTFGGRSAFRRYDTPRAFAFGNTYRRVLGGVNERGELFVCNESASSCRKYTLPDGRLFSPARERSELHPEEVEFVKERAIASLHSPAALPAEREYALIAKSDVQLLSTPNMQLIFSGQGLSARQGDRLEVELDFELRPGVDEPAEPSRIWLAHDLIDGEDKRRHYLRRVPGLAIGQRAKIRYHVVAPHDLEGIEARLRVHRFEGPAPVLHFHAARLRILPGDGPATKTGTVEEEFRVDESG